MLNFTDNEFTLAVKNSRNFAHVARTLNCSANVIKRKIKNLSLDVSHFTKSRYTEKELRLAVQESTSLRQVLYKLGLAEAGGNYKQIPRIIRELSLDTSHFTGKGHLKGKNHNWGKPALLEDILIVNSTYKGGSKLKNKLLKAGLIEDKCVVCGISHWHGQKLSLHLDHINGKNDDNRLCNLRLLCPNCHSLTPTYCGKNKGKCRRRDSNPHGVYTP